MNAERTDVLVLGGGPAGITFARTLRRLRPDLDVLMLRPEEHSMVYCAIPYALQGLFDAEKVYKKDALVTDAGVRLVRKKAVRVDLDRKEAEVEDGTRIAFETLFVATGARPTRPPIPGADARNVHTVKTQKDLEALLGRLAQKPRRAVVVGAGAVGVEQAQSYREHGVEVTLVERAGHVVPQLLDADLAEPVEARLRDRGVDVRLETSVTELEVEDDRVRGVRLDDGTRIDLDPERDFVCFAIGMTPELALLDGQGLEQGRDGLVVDAHMETSRSGVYAAGDVCRHVSGIDGEPIGGKLATNAVPMAKVAARNVAGRETRYRGVYNGAATCAYDLRIGSTGFTEDMARERGFEPVAAVARTQSRFPMMPGASDVTVKLVADAATGRVLGGQVVAQVSTTDKVDVLTLAVQRGLDVGELAELSYSAQPWQSFFPARSAIVDAAEQLRDRLAEPTPAL